MDRKYWIIILILIAMFCIIVASSANILLSEDSSYKKFDFGYFTMDIPDNANFDNLSNITKYYFFIDNNTKISIIYLNSNSSTNIKETVINNITNSEYAVQIDSMVSDEYKLYKINKYGDVLTYAQEFEYVAIYNQNGTILLVSSPDLDITIHLINSLEFKNSSLTNFNDTISTSNLCKGCGVELGCESSESYCDVCKSKLLNGFID